MNDKAPARKLSNHRNEIEIDSSLYDLIKSFERLSGDSKHNHTGKRYLKDNQVFNNGNYTSKVTSKSDSTTNHLKQYLELASLLNECDSSTCVEMGGTPKKITIQLKKFESREKITKQAFLPQQNGCDVCLNVVPRTESITPNVCKKVQRADRFIRDSIDDTKDELFHKKCRVVKLTKDQMNTFFNRCGNFKKESHTNNGILNLNNMLVIIPILLLIIWTVSLTSAVISTYFCRECWKLQFSQLFPKKKAIF